MKKLFYIFNINAFEVVARISLSYEENTCYRPSMCEETVLRFWMLFRESFSNSVCVGLVGNYNKTAAMQLWAVFWIRELVTLERCSERVIFWHFAAEMFKS